MLKELSARGVCTPRKEDIVRVPRPRNEGETLRKPTLCPPDLPDLITAVIRATGDSTRRRISTRLTRGCTGSPTTSSASRSASS